MTTTNERFEWAGGRLMHHVVPTSGFGRRKPYRHACDLATYTTVAHVLDESGKTGTTLTEIAVAEGLPHSRVAVALAFMKERGVAVTRYPRRAYPAADCAFEDAMCEIHALAGGTIRDAWQQ